MRKNKHFVLFVLLVNIAMQIQGLFIGIYIGVNQTLDVPSHMTILFAVLLFLTIFLRKYIGV
jgi:hypothetical protein